MTGRKVVLGLIGTAFVAAAAVLGADEGLRKEVVGAASALGEEIAGRD